MNKKDASKLKDNLKKIEEKKNAPVIKEKGFLDLYDLVANKKVCAVYDQNDNIIGLNGLMSNPTGLQHSKMVDGHMTVGRTEKERKADEKALAKFQKQYGNKPLLRWFGAIVQLIEADIKPDRVDDVNGKLYYYIVSEGRVIDDDGNEIVKLDKKSRRLSPDLVLDRLADKLALAIRSICPTAYDTDPEACEKRCSEDSECDEEEEEEEEDDSDEDDSDDDSDEEEDDEDDGDDW